MSINILDDAIFWDQPIRNMATNAYVTEISMPILVENSLYRDEYVQVLNIFLEEGYFASKLMVFDEEDFNLMLDVKRGALLYATSESNNEYCKACYDWYMLYKDYLHEVTVESFETILRKLGY